MFKFIWNENKKFLLDFLVLLKYKIEAMWEEE